VLTTAPTPPEALSAAKIIQHTNTHFTSDEFHLIWKSTYVWGREEVHTGTWWLNLRDRAHFEDMRMDWRIILKWTENTMTRYGLIWLRMRASGPLL
jgi:hypothetical protein